MANSLLTVRDDAESTKIRVNRWHAQAGVRQKKPDFDGPLVSPDADPDGARAQMIARLAVVLGHAWGDAYSDLEGIADNESLEADAATDALLVRYQTAVVETVQNCLTKDADDPVRRAFDDMKTVSAVRTPSPIGMIMVLREMMKAPAAFGVSETWNLHAAVPAVCARYDIPDKDDSDVWSAVASNSFPLSWAMSHMNVQMHELAKDELHLPGTGNGWNPEKLVLRRSPTKRGITSMELPPSFFTTVHEEFQARGLSEVLSTHVAVGCPAAHGRRPGSKESILKELHQFVGRIAGRMYKKNAKRL